jgi:very-short-patch-repair endonuclease
MNDGFEVPADIPYSLDPGSWVGKASVVEKILADIQLRRTLSALCESHIEVDLGVALLLSLDGRRFALRPQFPLQRFRYDFAIESVAGQVLLLIECDGKEFHSTPQQRANDRAKNEAAAAAGFRLARVTGSEIFRDAKLAAEHLMLIAGAF